jgi:crotonobetainyl-CoA:carnitine CoA-transferase CaiB-like acyl-CoA transferase
MESFGLDYETLSRSSPRLIYASLSGYGLNNPMSRRRAYDICVQSEAGLAFMNGEQDRRPHRIGYSVSDYGAGRDMVIGILAALYYREKTGQGQQIDSSMYDTCVSLTENAIPRYSLTGEVTKALGSRHSAASPHNLYETKDGHINIIAVENRLFQRLARAMGRENLIDHPLFGSPEGRRQHPDEMDQIVEAWTRTMTTQQVAEKLDSNGLPYGILHDIRTVVESEHTTIRDMAPTIEQIELGPLKVPGCPIKFSGSEARVRGAAPLIGEHNQVVLQGILGYSDDAYHSLVERGVILSES